MSDLTLRFGSMMVAVIGVVAMLAKLPRVEGNREHT